MEKFDIKVRENAQEGKQVREGHSTTSNAEKLEMQMRTENKVLNLAVSGTMRKTPNIKETDDPAPSTGDCLAIFF